MSWESLANYSIFDLFLCLVEAIDGRYKGWDIRWDNSLGFLLTYREAIDQFSMIPVNL